MTIRFRLIIRFLVVILLANLVLSVVTVQHISDSLVQEVQNRVRLDLNSARAVYDTHLDQIALFLRAVTLDPGTASAFFEDDPAEISTRLARLRESAAMDLLFVTDPAGRVLHRAGNLGEGYDDFSDNAVVARTIRSGSGESGTVTLSAGALRTVAGRPLGGRPVATRPFDQPVPVEGASVMAMAAATPLRDQNGTVRGLLCGAQVLNGRYEIVDTIRDQVFQAQQYGQKDVGTATIFQGDLRVSTNVRTDEGLRAVGTRMSPEVYKAVFEEGRTYAAPAYVVNDWYITSYEPIRDPEGQTIGALYVGVLQAPFAQVRNNIVRLFLLMVSVITVIMLLLLFLVTRQVLRPVQRVVEMSGRVIAGDLSARVGIRPAGELGQLCKAIDDMADAVAQREEQLKLATRRQVGQSEKLASIGRLAAGIAHEVNNPLTGILTFTHLLREKANLDEQDRQDLDLVIRETTRVRDIVRGLLDFARETPAQKEWIDINTVVQQTTRLLRSQKVFRQVVIEERLGADLPTVYGDGNQLQQVLLNLSLNACEAMPGGGRLTIATAERDDAVVVTVADTGQGISPDHLDHIFDPFFTTKPVGKGTGLGLSVSYGIVQQHGGSLEVDSEPGRGTVFTIVLPVAAPATTNTARIEVDHE